MTCMPLSWDDSWVDSTTYRHITPSLGAGVRVIQRQFIWLSAKEGHGRTFADPFPQLLHASRPAGPRPCGIIVGMSETPKKLTGINAEFVARRLLICPELESLLASMATELASMATELAQLQHVAQQFMSGNEHKVLLACEGNGYVMEVVIRRTTEGSTRATIIFDIETVTTDEASSN